MPLVRPFIVAAALTLSTSTALAQSSSASTAASDPRVTLTSPANSGTEPITIVDGVVASVSATVLAVPTSIALANAMTRLSPDLIGGAIPALLWLGFAPPFAANGLAVLAMNLHEPGRYNLWPSIMATVPVHWGAIAIGALSGVWMGNIVNLALFTLAESVVLPSLAVTIAWATRRPPRASVAPRARRAPSATVLADRSPLFRASQQFDARTNANTLTASSAVTVPVWSGSF
jgi:hypothetical protein